MADVPRDVTVTAELMNGQIKFSMGGDGVGGPKNEEIEFNKDKTRGMKKDDDYLVRFNLDDKTGENLRFVKPKKNAMWAKVVDDVNEPCPQLGDKLNQFRADQLIDDALIVRNKDKDRELIKFALNFIREDGDDDNPDEYVQYDPIGDNRNGGAPLVGPNIGRIAVITVGVAAVTVLAVQALSH